MSRHRSAAILAALAAAALAACTAAAPAVTPPATGEPPRATPVVVPAASPAATGATAATASPPPSAASAPTASPAAPAASLPTTRGTLPAALAGTFAARIDPAVVSGADEAGDWFLVLTPAGGYQFGRVARGIPENTGDLVIAGDRVTFANEQGLGACTPDGTYVWAIDGSRLTLRRLTDDCAVRVDQYVHQAYVRCPGGPATCAAVLP